MKAFCEVVELKSDIITTSTTVPCGNEDNAGSEVCDLD